MNPQQFEQLVQAVAEEILAYLGTAPSRGTCEEGDECPECEHNCVELCLPRTRRVIDAGAQRVSAGPMLKEVDAGIASLIDHTLLKPEATREAVRKLCEEARRFSFAAVVVNPWYVPLAAKLLQGSSVKVCTVVGFPLGATLPHVKMYETEEAIKLGADEIDMVINVGALKSGQDELVETDIRGVAETSHRGGAACKVILETALLTMEEKIRACVAAKQAGADFVKTSTGFGPGGATAEDVALMRAAVGSAMGVKAAGGIRSLEDLQKMVSAGATRIGASASVKILEEARGGAGPKALAEIRSAA